MSKNYVTVNQNPGINDNVNVSFGLIWKVTDLSTNTLVTTSGRLGTTDLADTLTQVQNGWQVRAADYTFTYQNQIVLILHQDDTTTVVTPT